MFNMASAVSGSTRLAERQQHWVTFRLCRQTYGLPIESIVQITEMVTIQPLPQAPHSLEGVITVRGVAVPVINMRCHLGLPPTKLQLHTPIVLVRMDERQVGLIVDEVIDVLSLSSDQVVPFENLMPDALSDVSILLGLVHTAQGIVLILDPENLLLAEPTFDLAATIDAILHAMPVPETEAPGSTVSSETKPEGSDDPTEDHQDELDVNV